MIDWELTLEFLKVLLSWPPLALAFGVILYLTFRKDISALLGRIKSGRLFGAEFDVSQKALTERDPAFDTLATTVEVEKPEPNISSPSADEAAQLLIAERAAARTWEYRFLNYFFAAHTQLALDWLLTLQGPISVYAFDTHWSSMIGNAEERRAILQALEAHNLIDMTGGNIRATDKGREYANWIGRARNPLLAPTPTSHASL